MIRPDDVRVARWTARRQVAAAMLGAHEGGATGSYLLGIGSDYAARMAATHLVDSKAPDDLAMINARAFADIQKTLKASRYRAAVRRARAARAVL